MAEVPPDRPTRTRLSIEFNTAKQQEAATLSSGSNEHDLPAYHAANLEDLLEGLGVDDVEQGISTAQAVEALKQHGKNKLRAHKPNRLWAFFYYMFGEFNAFMWFGVVLCFVSWRLGGLEGGTKDPGALALAIALVVVTLFNVAATIYSDYSSSAVMKSIQSMMSATTTVVRDGQTTQIPTEDVVPGDIVVLSLGERVPADLRIVSVHGLRVDQSILTGESEPVALRTKQTSDNYLESKNITFCGASVVEGSGVGLIVATGSQTMMGSIALKASKAKAQATYLSREIRRLIIIIGILCGVVAVACFVAYVAWLRTSHKGFISWSGIVGICLGLLIGCFPVGLPLCVTCTLLIVAKRMAKANVLVKDLTIIEALGSVNMIASDKTGTLTQNNMSVVEILQGTRGSVAGDASFVQAFRENTEQFSALVDIALNCNAAMFDPATIHLPLHDRTIVGGGGASDAALLKWVSLFVPDIEAKRAETPVVAEVPFNSKNKYAVSIHKLKKKKFIMYMKGAAEAMIARCTTYLTSTGELEELTPKRAKAILDIQIEMCRKGERVLAMISKNISPSAGCPFLSPEFNTDDYPLPLDSGFTFIGLTALMDPPRVEVPAVIERCHEAGIKVAMVTGDHPDTAETIARMIGIIRGDRVSRLSDFVPHQLPVNNPSHTHAELNRPTMEFFRDEEMARALPRAVVITGPEIAQFDDDTWDWVLGHRDLVFARTSPENKLEIVTKMQERKYSVAVTGDGVNDSPALRQADVGVAMGGGSEVAKEAAPVVLTDNNFKSLLAGVESGRIVFSNLKKVIRYLLSAGSFSEIWPVVFNVFLGLPQPLPTFLMLYICVITDVAPCLSLVFQKGEKDMMKRKPRPRSAHLLDGWIYLQSYAFVGFCESLTAFCLFFYYMQHYAGIPQSKLWLAYEKYTTNHNVTSTYVKPTGGYYTGAELDDHLKYGQSIFFVALVVTQFGNLLGMKEQRSSLFSANPLMGPARNLFLVASIFISTILALLIVYIPGINKLFGTRPIQWEFWFLPMYAALGIFICHELRKLCWRNIRWSSVRRALPDVTLTGQGSSLAAPIYSSWSFDYQLERTDVKISYSASGSGAGLTAVEQYTNHFGASDNALKASDRAAYPDLVQFPTVAAAVVVAFNLPNFNDTGGANLVLERDILARIYLGDIVYWNDTDLVNSQPDEPVKNYLKNLTQAIQVGARLESSGTTGIFTSAMCAFYPQWANSFPCTFNIWTGSSANANVKARSSDPNFHLLNQNFGVAGFVEVFDYSIGYIAYPTIAQENIFRLADMINKNGDRVTSFPPDLTVALTNATFDEYLVTSALIDSPAASAWPIGGPTYVIIRSGTNSSLSCANQRELLLFWKWTLTNNVAQLRLTFDGYSSLGDATHEKVLAELELIKCPATGISILGDVALSQHSGSGFIALLTIAEIIAVVMVIGVLVYLARDWRRIPAPAMFFFGALLFGAILNYISLGWFYLIPKEDYVCQLRKWFVALGFSCMFAAIFVRAFQIQNILLLSRSSKILASKKRQLKSLLVLIGTYAVIVGIQIVLLIIWTSIDPWQPIHSDVDDLRGTYTYICSSKHNWIWFGLEIGFFASLLLFGLYVVYRSWDMKHLIIESKYLAVTVYNSLVIMIIVIILFATLAASDSLVFYVAVGAVAFLTSFSIAAFIGPKLLRLSDNNSLATGTTGGSTYEMTRSKRTGQSKDSKEVSKSKDSYQMDSYNPTSNDSVREER